MLHDALRVVLRKSNAQVGEHSHVRSLKTKASFKEADELVKVAIALVLLDKLRKLLSMNNEVETANLSKTELLLGNTGLIDLPPDLHTVGLASTFNSSLIVLEVHKSGSKLGPVGDAGEEDLGRFMEALLISLVSRSLNVCDVGSPQELLELWQLVGASKAEGQGGVNRNFALGLASHPQELDKILVLACVGTNLNDLKEVRCVSSTDVRLNGISHTETVQLSLSDSAPHLGSVDTICIVLGTVDTDNVINQDVDSVDVLTVLLIDLEGLIVHANLDTLLSDVLRCVVLELLDVVGNTSTVGLGCCEHEEVLQGRVVAEGSGLQEDLLEQVNELSGHVIGNERLDGDADLV